MTQRDLQQTFFDVSTHQYAVEKIVAPPLAQQLEINHIETQLRLPKGAHLLDFGAGTGRTTIPFLARGYNVHAVDISEQSLTQLRQLYNEHKTTSWGKLTTSSTVPTKPTMDGVVGSDILHHVDIPQTLPLLYRCLKPQGRLVMSEPNAWHIFWYPFIFFRLSWTIEQGIVYCSARFLKRHLQKSGFSQVAILGHGAMHTGMFNRFPPLAKANASAWGNFPGLRLFAFRLLITAQK